MKGTVAPGSSFIIKIILLRYTWMVDVMILRWFSNKMLMDWSGRLCKVQKG